jgi:hypothetical protein
MSILQLSILGSKSQAMKRAISLGLICAFVFGIALASSPVLHNRVHADAQHECAATLIASGNYEHSAAPVIIVRPVALEQLEITKATPAFVSSLFLNACILEHAPPQNS